MFKIKKRNEGRPASGDRRREPRIQAAGTGNLTIRHPATLTKVTATIVDVSRSGFQIEVDDPLDSGSNVELRLREALVLGQVENCRPHKHGRYRIGIVTNEVKRA